MVMVFIGFNDDADALAFAQSIDPPKCWGGPPYQGKRATSGSSLFLSF